VPGSEIESILNAAPGNEIASGKFDSPESSAALAANAFGFFLRRASDLPALPGCKKDKKDKKEMWPAQSLSIEAMLRFPWRHLLDEWTNHPNGGICAHAQAVTNPFSP